MTSMPEVAAEWQNFDQLTAGKLYELLRFRHDLCDSKKFLELGCTIPGTIIRPSLRGTGSSNPSFDSLDLSKNSSNCIILREGTKGVLSPGFVPEGRRQKNPAGA